MLRRVSCLVPALALAAVVVVTLHQRVRNAQVAVVAQRSQIWGRSGAGLAPARASPSGSARRKSHDPDTRRRQKTAPRHCASPDCGLQDAGIDQGETTDARLFTTSPDGCLRRHRHSQHRVHRNSEHDRRRLRPVQARHHIVRSADDRHPARHRRLPESGSDRGGALHRLPQRQRQEGQEIRLVGRSRPAVRISDRRRAA